MSWWLDHSILHHPASILRPQFRFSFPNFMASTHQLQLIKNMSCQIKYHHEFYKWGEIFRMKGILRSILGKPSFRNFKYHLKCKNLKFLLYFFTSYKSLQKNFMAIKMFYFWLKYGNGPCKYLVFWF